MNFVADEGLDQPIVDAIRQIGHAVLAIAEAHQAMPDADVLELANSRRAILITADKDFGELVFRQGRITEGVILVRLAGVPPADKSRIVMAAVEEHALDLPGNFTVVRPATVRIRRRH